MAGQQVLFEDVVETNDMDVGALVLGHMALLHVLDVLLVEIEDLEQTDPRKLFLRIGTDPARMAGPMRIDL